MTERWKTYINGGLEQAGGTLPFAFDQWQFLFPLYLAIRRATPSGGRLLDVGCGAGAFASLLTLRGYAVTGVDQDADVVARARITGQTLAGSATFEQADAFDLSPFHGRFDLAYSIGVVEHFDRDVTVSLIREQGRCATSVMVCIPTKFTKYAATITDERIYTLRQLERMVADAGLAPVDKFVYGEVPTSLARNFERALPAALYRQFQRTFSYAMGIGVVGRRRAAR
jgi:2-polyprenyl-3-methyl-5-hydroxy-6-metoxy-1,4-benzoquinol methylase